MRLRSFSPWALALLALSSPAAAPALQAQTRDSGPKLGEIVEPFDVYDVTGPNKGNELCYVCQYGISPVVCIFTRTTSGPLTSLVKAVEEKMAEHPRLNAFVVRLTDTENEAQTVTALRDLAANAGISRVPLTLLDNPAGPPAYKIAEDAEVTVLFYRFFDVRAKHVFGPGELTEADIERILADLPKLLSE